MTPWSAAGSEPGHRTVQTSGVSGQGERHCVNHLARLEDSVADSHTVVERGDRRSSGVHLCAVDPHPDFIGLLALTSTDGKAADPLARAGIAQFAHGCTLLTVPPSQMPGRSGEPL